MKIIFNTIKAKNFIVDGELIEAEQSGQYVIQTIKK